VEVFLLNGPLTEKFVKKNPVVSRTIQIRGEFGNGPMDPKALSIR
jgi:hypothetical protein